MRSKCLVVTKVGALLLLAACQTTGSTTAPSPTPAVAPAATTNNVDQSDDFNFPNARIISRPSETSVLVEVRGLPNIPPNYAQIDDAAEQYCGGEAYVGLPVSTNRMRFNTIRHYLVRCQ